MHSVRVGRVAGDGNCLFSSIAVALKPFGTKSSFLRKQVAKSVLSEHPLLTAACSQWKILASHDDDFSFYRPLAKATLPLSKDNRLKLFRIMMSSDFWGEHYSLKVLSEIMQINFVVFTRNKTWTKFESNPKMPLAIFLQMENQHYSPVLCGLHGLFAADHLPKALQGYISKLTTAF